MSDVQLIIDFVLTAMLNVWNTLKNYAGIFFTVWLLKGFVIPYVNRLLDRLRG